MSFETDVVKTDRMRYITSEGRSTANKVFKALQDELKGIKIIYTSPLIRTVQTAEILASSLVSSKNEEMDVELKNELSTDTTIAKAISLFEISAEYNEICCIGHEPTMGKLMTHLSGQNITSINFKKSAVCKINFDTESLKSNLEWYFDPDEMNFTYKF